MNRVRTEAMPSHWLRRGAGTDAAEAADRRRTVLECGLLVVLMAAVGTFVVPSHWTSIWMDREFTGWVAPVANRLGEIRLYADGGHIPMPPLPFVFMRVVTLGHATWLSESLANFSFQALTLLAMYAGLRGLFRAPVPFLATAAAVPVFLSLPKTIVYDAMAQAFVALLGLGTLWHARRNQWRGLACEAGIHSRWSDVFSPSLVFMAAAAAACLLTKQSTGGGACLGSAAGLLLASAGPVRRRVEDVVFFAIWTALLGGMIVVALTPWIDPTGLVRDVFLTGSEPKGGSLRLLKSLTVFGLEIGQQGMLMAFTLVAVAGALGRGPSPATGANEERPAARLPGGLVWLPVLAALLTFLVFPAARPMERLFTGSGTIARQILWAGLLLGIVLAIRRRDERTPLLAVLLAAALFHSLSTPRFRWTYDNNPLIALAFALFLDASLDFVGRLKLGAARPSLVAGFVLLVVGFAWLPLGVQLAACQACCEPWPEVEYLAGARLPASAEGMRQTVALVRELTSESDPVLLLPNDPNVEAWFDRPRPRLSAPIVFADQYWDRLLDGDLASLRADLPRVIVIGPRNFWHGFHEIWQQNYGAGRLIDLVAKEILPVHYSLHRAVPIQHHGKIDAMDVYVRNR